MRTSFYCPECSLSLECDSRLIGDGFECPFCRRFILSDEIARSRGQCKTIVRDDTPLLADMIPLVLGAALIFFGILACSRLLSCAFELNILGVIGACLASCFVLWRGDESDASLEEEPDFMPPDRRG